MSKKKILRVGVIGCGMGAAHMKGVKANPHAVLTAICDNHAGRLQETAEQMNVTNTYLDYRDMIARDDLDAVIIASPDQLHREMIVNTLNAGKHILCEKPLALTREDCEAIVKAVNASDRKFMVGQICRYTPGFKKAKEIIDSGAIGELTFIESEYAHDYTHVFTTRDGSWRLDPVRNGVVGGGCHAVDLLRWIAGTNPEEVTAYATHKTFADLVPYDDTTIAILKFPDGVIGKVFCSISCKRDYTMRSVFYGTKGTIIVDNTSPQMTVFKQDVFPGLDNHETPLTIPINISNHNVYGEFDEFCDIILNDKAIKTTVEEGANTIETCLAIVESATEGKSIRPRYF